MCSILFPWHRTGCVNRRRLEGSFGKLCRVSWPASQFWLSDPEGLPRATVNLLTASDLAGGMITYFTAQDPWGRALIFGR